MLDGGRRLALAAPDTEARDGIVCVVVGRSIGTPSRVSYCTVYSSSASQRSVAQCSFSLLVLI